MELIIEELLGALSDGAWHNINELSTIKGLRKLSITKLMVLLDFLAEYDFIELSQEWKGDPLRSVVEAKLQPSVQQFLTEIIRVETTEKKWKG